MYPNVAAGSRLIALRKPYGNASQVQRGDIVIISWVEDGAEIKYIWRVVGLPGDRIQTSLNSVSVNGKPLPLTKLRADGAGVIFSEANGPARYEVFYENDPKWIPPEIDIVVPAEHYFVLGDNRHQAGKDSRTIDTIPFKSIVVRSGNNGLAMQWPSRNKMISESVVC